MGEKSNNYKDQIRKTIKSKFGEQTAQHTKKDAAGWFSMVNHD